MPPAILPSTMLSIAKTLPTYQAADLGWHIADGQAPTWTERDGAGAVGLGFLLVAGLFARRAARVR